jgi:hypothetical protein
MKDNFAVSEFTGEPVNTWSEEWRHECELRAVLAMPKSSREAYFNGVKDSKERGIIAVRGQAATDRIRAGLARLEEIRASRIT